jgi:hypothetical protein
MSTNRWIPVIAAAWLAAGTACSDATAPADRAAAPADQPPPAQISIVGIVHLTTDLRNSFMLSTDDGRDIVLIGGSLASVAQVDSAQVEVRGAWTADGAAFEVNDFVVRSVEGAPAMDGILIARYDDSGQDLIGPTLLGYGLQLTRGGTIALTDPPADLVAHLGERVWVTGDPTAAPTAFGFIQ